MRTDKVYRGVVVERIHSVLKSGTPVSIDAHRRVYLKPYDKPGPAKASVTKYRNSHAAYFIQGYVEVSESWTIL